MKKLLTGNEAIARGAYEAGALFCSAYPGTPSTEILENLAGYPEVHAEWAPNEKVALEAAIGASLAGARSMASMKHVGVNVAADPLMSVSYMGVNGGLVIVSADEPGMFSSQNEQDNRNYAKMGKFPMLEPSDSQECYEMVKEAFRLSEESDVIFMIRMTTRVCHSKSLVEIGSREEVPLKEWTKEPSKYVCVPANARVNRVKIEDRTKSLAGVSENSPFNFAEENGKITGVITSGVCYQYAKEVFGSEASYLKLGFTNPLPKEMIEGFSRFRDVIYVIEEDDPYIEDYCRSLGINVRGKDVFPPYGEMLPHVIRESLAREGKTEVEGSPWTDASGSVTGESPEESSESRSYEEQAIRRPPTLCSGCPHRGLFYRLGARKDLMITGDIGCYTLAAAPPYNAMDTCVCMGASISMGHGASTAYELGGVDRKVVTVLGDSTFFHTGVESLINTVYNKSSTLNIILDNRTTGMTGHQENPGTGRTASGERTIDIDIEALVKAIGIKHVRTIDPNDLDQVDRALDDFLALDEPSVIITRWPCALKRFTEEDKEEFPEAFKERCFVQADECIGCQMCIGTGCPSLKFNSDTKKVSIDGTACTGCSVCMQVCPVEAIKKEGR